MFAIELPDDAKLTVLLAMSEGQPVAGHVSSLLGDTCIYLLGASNDEGRNTRAAYLLQFDQRVEYVRPTTRIINGRSVCLIRRDAEAVICNISLGGSGAIIICTVGGRREVVGYQVGHNRTDFRRSPCGLTLPCTVGVNAPR